MVRDVTLRSTLKTHKGPQRSDSGQIGRGAGSLRGSQGGSTPKKAQRRGGFRQPEHVLELIAEKGLRALRPPKQIVGDVKAAYGISISEKTVSRVLDAERKKETASERELWDPMADNTHGIDPALVLPAVAFLIQVSEGRRRQFTRAEARWIFRVRRAAPDIPIELAYTVASLYVRTNPANVLDAYLAYGPWRGDAEHRKYINAMKEGWVPRWGPGMGLRLGDWEAEDDQKSTR